MIDKNKIIVVTNRDNGTVGYTIPELGITRRFEIGETKKNSITWNELEQLSYIPGGEYILKNCLVIEDEEAVKELFGGVEPEYFYTEADIKRLMTTGTLDEFLDCLDFAPVGVQELIKTMAVELPLNDVEKRDAILEKLNFNVTRAIEIKNTKFDGEDASTETKTQRRVAVKPEVKEESGRRTAAPKYKVVNK